MQRKWHSMSSSKLTIQTIIGEVLQGRDISMNEALNLAKLAGDSSENYELICEGANQIREKYVGNHVDLCTILSAKSGKCSENCKYCAQSVHHDTKCDEYDLQSYEAILLRAKEVEASGAHRFSLVTSGRSIESEGIIEPLVDIYRRLKEDTSLQLCASHGMATEEELKKLKEAGVSMYHHNVETTARRYELVCDSHTFEDRLNTIKNAREVGLGVCSGGIIGMGETMADRIEMAFELQALGIKSVPVNVLMPIVGTPMENYPVLEPEEIILSMALYRIILKDVSLRYAGGRMALKHLQQKGFKSGVNAALVGNFLTTLGSNVEEDKKMIHQAGLSWELNS